MNNDHDASNGPDLPVVGLEKDVLDFFVQFFAVQLGLTEEDEADVAVRCLDADSRIDAHAYEITVKTEKDVRMRRMALGPLGENSGSKSQCFKVVYDELLVIKVPPKAVTDFNTYIELIRGERRVADRLSPTIECIAPSVSALLRKIPKLKPSAELSPQTVEKGYVQLLAKKPWLQDYLKIGDNFIFFMSLAKFSFLGNIVKNIHDIDRKVQKEILGQHNILLNMMDFEEVFGVENSGIFFDINELYTAYEEQVNVLLKNHGYKAAEFRFSQKQWFLLRLARREADIVENTLPPKFYRELKDCLAAIFEKGRDVVIRYRQMVRDFIHRKMFNQNRIQFRGLVLNILELLYRLQQSGIAIRDLKPDNIFVMSEKPDNVFAMSDAFMDNSVDFLLGLIDFETAIDLKGNGSNPLPQPLQAGTPSLATPSHLADNGVIQNALGSCETVIRLQDWYASIGMIFHVMTGETLFVKTRRYFSGTWKILADAKRKGESPIYAFKMSSKFFWNSADSEFREKLSERKDLLDSVELTLPEHIRCMLETEIRTCLSRLETAIRRKVESQRYFKNKQDLIRCRHRVVKNCLVNWEKGVSIPKTRPETRESIIVFFAELEQLKRDFEMFHEYSIRTGRTPCGFSVLEIMNLLFHVVHRAMYDPEWAAEIPETDLPDLDGDGAEDARSEPYEETVAYEETAVYDSSSDSEETIAFGDPDDSEGMDFDADAELLNMLDIGDSEKVKGTEQDGTTE